ncbi:ankyrin-3 [Caerostris extrusa]|uniref:Ankyrin-3 n=1 Tax=Caerostris extrusa TaxID=172846 RepID=A0AAV4VMM7_CAEEX|nr:ankyrin-3 [Caerostris extrusa]
MAVYHCDLRMTVILMQNGANMHCIDMHRCSPLDVMMFLCTAHDVKTLSLRQEDCCREFRKLIAKGETVKVEDLLPTAKALFKFDILKNVKSSALFQKWFTKAIPRDLHQYLNDCVSEIKSMKSATIDENFSMYNFIMEDKNSDLSGSDCSEKVLECIFRHPTTIRFPIYCDAIIPKLEKDSLQQKLCEYKIYTTNQIEEIDLVNDVVAHLVQYLPKFDIFNLISAYSDGERTCQKKRKHSASILVKGDALPKNVKRKRH